MPKPDTLKRYDFNYNLALLIVYAYLKDIKFDLLDHNDCKRKEKHEQGRAKDVVILDKKGKPIYKDIEDYHILGKFWKGLGGHWDKSNIIHFEY